MPVPAPCPHHWIFRRDREFADSSLEGVVSNPGSPCERRRESEGVGDRRDFFRDGQHPGGARDPASLWMVLDPHSGITGAKAAIRARIRLFR